VPAQSYFKVRGLSGGQTEFVSEYLLLKGHHYMLSIYYEGEAVVDQEGRTTCQVFDLTMSISHNAQMVLDTRCTDKDETESMLKALPQKITDHDLDREGNYVFEKTVRLHHPGDFKDITQFKGQEVTPEKTFSQLVMIDMKHNYDINSFIEFEYD